ncbi:hypothetical protein CCH79_00002559 [Gambusia affinis]|uniref:SOCS box domain-containing protein n=1 Tax=Gambusia affinis TaxID=33528 RepID=A0A315W5T9_GAMAF|nr:hypothetical protein CCH79_00002559 [Gambusia affinis]
MAIENKPEEEFDTVFNLNDSLEFSSHSEHDCGKARIFKIIVIGDSNVGKTCLTYRFCGGTFLKNPEATIGVDFRERTVVLDGETIKIWDTAGQERFRKSMVEHYYRSVHAVIFVYDVTNLPSFESLPEWVEECSKHAVGPLVPRIITSAKDPAEKEHVDAIFLTLAYRLKSHKPLRLKQLSESSVRELRNQREQETTFCQC